MSWRREFFSWEFWRTSRGKHQMCSYVYPTTSTTENSDHVHRNEKAVFGPWWFCGWIICPHFIAHQAWEDLPDPSAGYRTHSWASFKTAVTPDSLSCWTSLLCAPDSLPIPFRLNVHITGQAVLALLVRTGNSTGRSVDYGIKSISFFFLSSVNLQVFFVALRTSLPHLT